MSATLTVERVAELERLWEVSKQAGREFRHLKPYHADFERYRNTSEIEFARLCAALDQDFLSLCRAARRALEPELSSGNAPKSGRSA